MPRINNHFNRDAKRANYFSKQRKCICFVLLLRQVNGDLLCKLLLRKPQSHQRDEVKDILVFVNEELSTVGMASFARWNLYNQVEAREIVNVTFLFIHISHCDACKGVKVFGY